MTETNPVPPSWRTATHVQLTAAALEGAFRLQQADASGSFVYPPREATPGTLDPELTWVDADRGGRVLATTRIHVPSSPYFQQHTPWPIVLVLSQAGPSIIAHALADFSPGDAVRLALGLDRAGRVVVVASAHDGPEGALRDEFLFSAADAQLDVRGGGSHAPALVKAALDAGAARVWVDAETAEVLGDVVDERIVQGANAPADAWPLRTDFS